MCLGLKDHIIDVWKDEIPDDIYDVVSNITLGVLVQTDAVWSIAKLVNPVASSDIHHLLITIISDMRARSNGAASIKKFYLSKKAYQALVGKDTEDMPQILFMRKPIFQSDLVPTGLDVVGIGESKFNYLPYDKLLITGRLINE
jgi:hypothetical protein